LLFSDVGSLPDKEWVRELALPFLSDRTATVSLGRSECQSDSALAKAVCRLILQDKEEIDGNTYLASGRSIGVLREQFINVDGFPESLTLAGEDTLFNLKLRAEVKEGFYYSPNAVAKWMPPKSFKALWKMLFRYAKGDAESGIFYKDYLNRIVELSAFLLGVILSILCFYYSIKRHQYGVLILSAVLVYFAVSPLLAYQHRLKRFALQEKLLAPLLLISSQALGFISGLISSR